MLWWDAKRAGFASVFFGRGLNLLGFLRQPNLYELEKDGFLRPCGLYGNVPELRGGRLVSGRMEERRWGFQVMVKRRRFGRRVARSGIDSPGKGRAGYAEIFHVLTWKISRYSMLIGRDMEPVIQEEATGCGIAASAALAGISYAEAKRKANALGIYAADTSLWSETAHVRNLLREFGISVSPKETPFESWEDLPGKALMAIKWRMEQGKPFWHWVVFVREDCKAKVLDSKKALKSNVRRDFGRIKPKWYIGVSN